MSSTISAAVSLPESTLRKLAFFNKYSNPPSSEAVLMAFAAKETLPFNVQTALKEFIQCGWIDVIRKDRTLYNINPKIAKQYFPTREQLEKKAKEEAEQKRQEFQKLRKEKAEKKAEEEKYFQVVCDNVISFLTENKHFGYFSAEEIAESLNEPTKKINAALYKIYKDDQLASQGIGKVKGDEDGVIYWFKL